MSVSAPETETTDEDRPLSVHLADARAAARRAREDIAALEERLDQVEMAADAPDGPAQVQETEMSWAAKLWSVPAETRLDAEQAAEATGRSKSRIYKLTSADDIPHRKAAGSLVFVAGELRTWLRERESVEVEGRMETDSETDWLRRTS